MATRTIGSARFDHGAQHFAVRSPEVADIAQSWERSGVVRRWYRADNGTDRLVGAGGMRRIPEFLARSLQVKTAVTVERLEVEEGAVTAFVDRDSPVTARGAVVTPPLPQTLTLLRNSGIGLPGRTAKTLSGIRYRACLAVMASLDEPSGLPNGHISPATGPIGWIADNAHKGVSPAPSITIHSTPQFAESHLEDDPEIWSGLLVSAAHPFHSGVARAVHSHRWRYAEPLTTLESGCEVLDTPAPVVVAGEVFTGARIEGAVLSGLAAADVLIDQIG